MLVVRPALLYEALASVAYLRNRLGVAEFLLGIVADGARHRILVLVQAMGMHVCVSACVRERERERERERDGARHGNLVPIQGNVYVCAYVFECVCMCAYV